MAKKTQVTNKKSETKNPIAVLETGADARMALLIVSLIVNAFAISLWVALRVTDQYDEVLSLFFLGR